MAECCFVIFLLIAPSTSTKPLASSKGIPFPSTPPIQLNAHFRFFFMPALCECAHSNLYKNHHALHILTSTGNGQVMPPRCAIGVDGPTDIDGERCILLTRCTVKFTVVEAANRQSRQMLYDSIDPLSVSTRELFCFYSCARCNYIRFSSSYSFIIERSIGLTEQLTNTPKFDGIMMGKYGICL